MQITEAEVIRLSIPFSDGGKGEGPVPRSLAHASTSCCCASATDAGLVGWGEAFSYHLRQGASRR